MGYEARRAAQSDPEKQRSKSDWSGFGFVIGVRQ